MFVKSLEIENIRNYRNLSIEFSDKTNLFYGDNAQGKTNILEAVYLASTARSYKGSKDSEIINFDADEGHIKMYVDRNGSEYRIDMHLKKNKNKGIALNGIPVRRASELFGISNCIFFSPEDLGIIKNGPSMRRRFMDMELCQLDPIYTSNLSGYNKALLQRNKLLKDLYFEPSLADTLDVWDMQLVRFGTAVIKRRREFIEDLNTTIQPVHTALTGGREEIRLDYEMNCSADEFAKELERSRDRDMKMKVTNVGPHKDDIVFESNSIDLRHFGSQGQQRTAALSLKLSEIEIVKNHTGMPPILMLDDVLSELDSKRQEHLLNGIRGVQTLITCTGLDDFKKMSFSVDRMFHVVNGMVTVE